MVCASHQLHIKPEMTRMLSITLASIVLCILFQTITGNEILNSASHGIKI